MKVWLIFFSESKKFHPENMSPLTKLFRGEIESPWLDIIAFALQSSKTAKKIKVDLKKKNSLKVKKSYNLISNYFLINIQFTFSLLSSEKLTLWLKTFEQAQWTFKLKQRGLIFMSFRIEHYELLLWTAIDESHGSLS